MKTICLYSAQIHLTGGIESVVRDLYALLPANGIRVVAAVEHGRPAWIRDEDFLCLDGLSSAERLRRWDVAVARWRPDCVVIQHTLDDRICADIAHLRERGVRCAKMMHSPFDEALLEPGSERNWEFVGHLAQLCGTVFTVSRADAQWWAALGFPAIKIQNPIRVPTRTAKPAAAHDPSAPLNVLWVGRASTRKQPAAAVEAVARAAAQGANLRLTMIGGGTKCWKDCRRLAKRLGAADRVTCLASRPNIDDLWAAADVHLFTSTTESFGLVLAEAKASGVPTVMFDLPTSDLAQARGGVVAVPPGDLDGLASALVRLAGDRALCARLGEEARASLAGFDAAHVVADWQAALRALETGEGFAEASDDARLFARQIAFGWKHYCDRSLWLADMEGDANRFRFSFRGLARLLRRAVTLIQSLKAWRRRMAG